MERVIKMRPNKLIPNPWSGWELLIRWYLVNYFSSRTPSSEYNSLSICRVLVPTVLKKTIIRLIENTRKSLVIYYISFHTVNFPCFLPYSFPTWYWMICQHLSLMPPPMNNTTKSCIYGSNISLPFWSFKFMKIL
jgi:hypothetical protein